MIQLWFIGLLAAVAVMVSAVGSGYKHGRAAGSQEIQAQWDAERAQAAIKAQELQSNMDKLREGKSRELARLNRTVAALSDSLRDRPSRRLPEVASDGTAGGGCSGPQLYREDAELVVAEAERADRIRLQLIQCQAAYESARQASDVR